MSEEETNNIIQKIENDKNRHRVWHNKKYHTDEEYRKRCIEKSKLAQKKKAKKLLMEKAAKVASQDHDMYKLLLDSIFSKMKSNEQKLI